MAIPIQAAAILARERKRRPFSGKILQLGRQLMLFDRARFDAFRAHWGLTGETLAGAGRPTDVDLFKALGFETVCSCDVSNFEGADYIFNLNDPAPRELEESFDCVFDGGTVEHIFNAGVAMASISRMVKVGGRAIHYVVSSNHIDHSFYMFSPTFFADFYKANGFKIETILLIENNMYGSVEFATTWKLYEYTQGMLKDFEFSGLGGNLWSMIIVATKEHAGADR